MCEHFRTEETHLHTDIQFTIKMYTYYGIFSARLSRRVLQCLILNEIIKIKKNV